jgi:hypothetical protein
MTTRDAGAVMLDGLDYMWDRVRSRLNGLTQDEYRWEPVSRCWSVRPGDDGVWRVERVVPEPAPAPVTTIAWRLWHIASDCLAGYTIGGLGPWPLPDLPPRGQEWYADVEPALDAVDLAWTGFRSGVGALDDDAMWQPLGQKWGPYAEDPWLALVLHATDEVVHHGAEIALLRDLYAAQVPAASA